MSRREVVWRVADASFRYPSAEAPAIRSVSFQLERGSCTAVLGPNGSGKSTLLRLLLGTLAAEEGVLEFCGTPLAGWSRQRLALEIGVVTQLETIAFPITVRELVAMGRYPHLGPWRSEGERDRAAVESAMRRCDVHHLRHRTLSTLSGGERQRARLARALAQEPSVLALDEPTVALDIAHEMAIFELLRGLRSTGVTVLLVTHHLNLAARYADRLLLLDRGRLVADGSPADVLRRPLLERVYDWPLHVTSHPGPGLDAGAPQVTPLAGGESSPPTAPPPTAPERLSDTQREHRR